jgi:GTP cyclohydrolase I
VIGGRITGIADEKFVTEQAYENPRFVEDMVREAHSRQAALDNITWFSVEAENFESILRTRRRSNILL